MSKYCSNCGKEMPDYAVVCGECGTPFEEAGKPGDKQTGFGKNLHWQGDKKKLLKLAGGALAVILLLIIAVSVFGSSGPEKIAKTMVKKTLTGHYSDVFDYYWLPMKKEFEQYAEDRDMELDEYLDEVMDVSSFKEFCEELDEEREESLEDRYGDFKFKITRVKIDEYDEDELEEFREDTLEDWFEQYEDVCDYDPDDVKKVCEFTVKVKITDEDDDTDKVTYTGIMLKLKGKWKVLYFN